MKQLNITKCLITKGTAYFGAIIIGILFIMTIAIITGVHIIGMARTIITTLTIIIGIITIMVTTDKPDLLIIEVIRKESTNPVIIS